MARPSKFTANVRTTILQALQVGASRTTAAAIAGIGESTLRDWIARGKAARPESSWAKFVADVIEAEAHPKVRALGIIYNAMEDKPELAWRFIERREHGFAPPQPMAAPQSAPAVITLAFPGVRDLPRLVPNGAEAEVSDVPNELPGTATAE